MLFRYQLSLIKRSVKALQLADKVSLRIDTRGVLSMQFMIHQEDKQIIHLDFFVCEYSD